MKDPNPPVLYLKFEKSAPDCEWEILVPLTNQRFVIKDAALNKSLDLLFLMDSYEVSIAEPVPK